MYSFKNWKENWTSKKQIVQFIKDNHFTFLIMSKDKIYGDRKMNSTTKKDLTIAQALKEIKRMKSELTRLIKIRKENFFAIIPKDKDITEVTLKIINETDEPLETKEIEEMVRKHAEDVTRTKLFYRLNNLRGEGLIKGKFVGPGKGVWIWWRKDAF